MKKWVYIILLLLSVTACVQKFQPAITSPPSGYLVVEGIINSSGPATVNLSRTNILSDSSQLYETGAAVQVEGNDNSVYAFTEKGKGIYGTDSLNLNTAQQYRLHIKTSAGKEYASDFVPVKITPPIDSLNWNVVPGGVQVYGNAHDPQNNTIYYKWDYEETWEFHSPYVSDLQYDTLRDANNNPLYDADGRLQLEVVVSPNVNYDLYFCWHSLLSSSILITSTVKLTNDVVSDFPLSFIPQGSDKLGIEYSILAKQHAITADAYNFLQVMKKNTEETGSIFSAQPSALQGNIHCVSNPSEIVVGYVGFSTEQSSRMFISNAQLTNWSVDPVPSCSQMVYDNQPDKVLIAFSSSLLPTTPVNVDFATGEVITFNAARAACVDCRLTGTNQKPSYWP